METQIITNASYCSKFSTLVAIGSFGIGTLLLLLHLGLPHEEKILILGFVYVVIAGLINGIVLLDLLFRFTINPLQRELIAIKILLLLVNIPIAYLYFFIVSQNFNLNF